MCYDLYPLLKKNTRVDQSDFDYQRREKVLNQKTSKIKFISMRQLGDKETIKNQTLKKSDFTYRSYKMV